jgi:hypothetical protein
MQADQCRRSFTTGQQRVALLGAILLMAAPFLLSQQAPPADASAPAAATAGMPEPAGPIAIVPLDSKSADAAARVTGALTVSQGNAIIAASGTITSGSATTVVTLPHRGVLRVCASTTIKLAADSSVPAGEVPGLLMAMEQGAVEASFATGRNSDILMTPDFRILIGGPGAADVKVRLGQHGDTCVDNAGANSPYVLVTSVFDGGVYRVQPGQRVMFQHGKINEVVDQEKEPCGCPPDVKQPNEFPLAQSEGLTPLAGPPPSAQAATASESPQTTATLAYNGADKAASQTGATAAHAAPATPAPPPAIPATTPPTPAKKPGFFGRVGKFFKKIFGAD